MRYDREPQDIFETRFFASDACCPVPARWKHWPLVALLAALPAPPFLRNVALNVWGAALLEGPYCQFMASDSKRANVRAGVLENQQGAVVAFATCVPDNRWPGISLLDLFAHPAVATPSLINLLESLPLPAGKTHCYADADDAQKIRALQDAGFQRMAVLPAQYRAGDAESAWQDVWLYARH